MGGGSPGSASEGLDPGKLAARAGSARPPARQPGAGWSRLPRRTGAGKGAEARGQHSAPGRLGRLGARGRLGCDGAGRVSGAETPAPPSAGPATPTPRAKMATWTAGEPGARGLGRRGGGGGGEDGTEGERRQKKKKKKGPAPGNAAAPAYFFFSFSPPAPSMANRCPAVPSRPAGPGLRSGLSAGSVRTRRERGKSRGGVRGETPPPTLPNPGTARRRELQAALAGGSGSGSSGARSSGSLVRAWPDTAGDGGEDGPRVPSDEEASVH